MAHVVWDWNGTLLADLAVTVDAVNAVITEYGVETITAEDYALHYRRPVRQFYDHLLGRNLDEKTWEHIDKVWHAHYHARLPEIPLAEHAVDTLRSIADAGHSQSLLSMWWHDLLVAECDRREISSWFTRIDGNQRSTGDRKAVSLVGHLTGLGIDSSTEDILLIGDTLDDAEAAHGNGARAVLVTSTTHLDRLRVAGVPIIDCISELPALL